MLADISLLAFSIWRVSSWPGNEAWACLIVNVSLGPGLLLLAGESKSAFPHASLLGFKGGLSISVSYQDLTVLRSSTCRNQRDSVLSLWEEGKELEVNSLSS